MKLNKNMSYIFDCAKKIKNFLKPYQLLVLESTVYPGATDELINIVKQKKIILGKNFFVGYSTERENPGDKNFSYKKTPKIISGFSKNCLILMDALYKHIIPMSYYDTSALIKCLNNFTITFAS